MYADSFNYNRKLGILETQEGTFVNGQWQGGGIVETLQLDVSQWKNSVSEQYTQNKTFDAAEYVFIIHPADITYSQLKAITNVRVYDLDGSTLFDGKAILPRDIGDSGRIYLLGVEKPNGTGN